MFEVCLILIRQTWNVHKVFLKELRFYNIDFMCSLIDTILSSFVVL